MKDQQNNIYLAKTNVIRKQNDKGKTQIDKKRKE